MHPIAHGVRIATAIGALALAAFHPVFAQDVLPVAGPPSGAPVPAFDSASSTDAAPTDSAGPVPPEGSAGLTDSVATGPGRASSNPEPAGSSGTPADSGSVPGMDLPLPGEGAVAPTAEPPIDPASIAGARDLGTTVVRAAARGKLLGRKERRDADHRKDVITQESILEHPDPDVADALQRAPGVSLQRDHGEGHMVQIRGSEPRLSTVTLNGQKMTSTTGDSRAASLDVVPVDQLAEIEVAKVLMPEMDGDAIGGTVNLVTQGARDTQLVAKGLLASGYDELSGRPKWQGSVALSRRILEDGALGLYVGGSHFANRTRSDVVAIEWDTIPGNREVIWNLDLRRYRRSKERTGLSGRVDWKARDGAILFLTANWNRLREDYLRERLTIHREGAPQRDPSHPDSFMTDDALKYSRQAKEQGREESVVQTTVGGAKRVGGVLLDLSATGSRSRGTQDPSFLAVFSPIHQMGSYIEASNPYHPTFSSFYYPRPVAIDPRFGQSSEYVLSQILSTWKHSGEDDLHGRFDARFAPASDSDLQFKTGGKWGWSRKFQNVGSTSFRPAKGSAAPSLSAMASDDSASGFHDDRYVLGPMPDLESVRSWLSTSTIPMDSSSTSDQHIQNDPQNYSLVQNHLAGYGQGRWKAGDLVVVGGLRAERFEIASTGNVIESQADQTWSNTVEKTADRTFLFLLPMVSARWSPVAALVARASYTRSFALPDAMDLLPTSQTDLLDLTSHVGNPDLDATLADAVELDLEWYRAPRGFASAGVFGKRLTDYIFPSVWGKWDDLRKAPFTYYGKVNGDEAFLTGLELEAQQPFDFLPGWSSGFGIEGNYTWTNSVTTLPGRTGESTLPGQSDHVANLGLRFDRWGFSTVVAWNWQSAFLYQVGASPMSDTWVDGHRRMDVSASQRLGRHALLYGRLANLYAAPYRFHMGDRSHPTQIENPSWSVESGLRLSL